MHGDGLYTLLHPRPAVTPRGAQYNCRLRVGVGRGVHGGDVGQVLHLCVRGLWVLDDGGVVAVGQLGNEVLPLAMVAPAVGISPCRSMVDGRHGCHHLGVVGVGLSETLHALGMERCLLLLLLLMLLLLVLVLLLLLQSNGKK